MSKRVMRQIDQVEAAEYPYPMPDQCRKETFVRRHSGESLGCYSSHYGPACPLREEDDIPRQEALREIAGGLPDNWTSPKPRPG